jgi:hypothetical protein
MTSDVVAAEGPGGVSVKAMRELTKNDHVGVLTESAADAGSGDVVAQDQPRVESSAEEDVVVDREDEEEMDHAAVNKGGPTNEKSGESLQSTPRSQSNSVQNNRPSIVETVAASSSYMDDSQTKGHDPHSLYGSFTWKVPNFKDVSKRELKSSSFSVGPYKWYILVYPNGCDVSNHLSLFLCVADYDKLLPGWSHFAQFTIAVVNKDPKKSKYSDTLHRFCKKEHDWGWKKFMELGKMQDGFVVSDTLVIKVQVQVIKDRQTAPFRTLDAHYRRELIRVYLSNIEGIVRRSIDKTKEIVRSLMSRGVQKFWQGLSEKERLKLSATPSGPLLKSFTKAFFNEKEVTSTLMMDAAYCAMKVLDLNYRRKFEQPSQRSTGHGDITSSTALESYLDSLESNIYLQASKNAFVFKSDALDMLSSFLSHPFRVYPFADKSSEPTSSSRSGNDNEALDAKDLAERDEIKLIDLARLTLEVFAMTQIAEQNIDKAWMEAEIIRRQEELIREEEEASKDEAERLAAKAEAERERKARKRERQRAKKEAERAKQEAIEAAKAKEEAEKKAEQERKRQEAEERKRQEEAKKEAERQRQLQIKQAALAAKKLAKMKPQAIEEQESKSVQSTQDDTDSAEDSSAITSARSDQSSMKCGTKSKGTTNGGTTPRDVSQVHARESGSTQDNIVAEMRVLLQKRDDEICLLKSKVRSLEEDLESALARIASLTLASDTSPHSRSPLAPAQHIDESAVPSHRNMSHLVQQAGVSSHAYIMQQMAKTANPSESILTSAMSQRGSQSGDGMKSSRSQPDVSSLLSAAQSSVNFRTSTQPVNQAGHGSMHPGSTRQQHLGHNGQFSGHHQVSTGYTGSEPMMNTAKVVGYRQFSHQTSASQVQNPSVGNSTNRMSPKMSPHTNQAFSPNTQPISSHSQRQFNDQGARAMGESSGLDDFAHLGLITDLLE